MALHPHVFQHADLAAYACLVGNTSQRSEVVMVTYSAELQRFSIQEEAFSGNDFHGTDTENGLYKYLSVFRLRRFWISAV